MDDEEIRGVTLHHKFHHWQLMSGTTIKVIGIILMTLDHLHQMFIAQGAPDWLNWFGRPVASLFLFLCAEGFYYTRNKKRYLAQLLIGFLFMSVMNRLLSRYLYLEDIALINNIFGTLLLAAFYMAMIDLIREGIREKQGGKITLALGGMLFPALIAMALLFALNRADRTILLILLFIPNLLSVEGGFILVLMGVLFYILRRYRFAQAGVVLVIGLISAFTAVPGNFQWLMVTAILPILLYNGQRGRGGKYFFYIFYPAHIYLFYIIAWLLTMQNPGF
ncbi:conjugal transfer protein TraX [Treponema sp. TIM-1]|uniref:TraX family protein n=1 Tax=Treponema sp. TIM-1 TaxID=2898417 RepID=UPI00397FC1B3